MKIYIDGSGDPGLNIKHILCKHSKEYCCLGVVALQEITPESVTEKMRRKHLEVFKKKLPAEIKYLKLRKEARSFAIKHLINNEIQCYILGLDKRDRVTGEVADFQSAGMNARTIQKLMLSRLMENMFQKNTIVTSLKDKIDIYFDEGTHEPYAKILERQVRRYKQAIKIHKPVRSKNDAGAQLADLLAGSFYHFKLSKSKEEEPFNLIKDRCSISEIRLEKQNNELRLVQITRI